MEWYQIVIGIVVGLICLMTIIILHELGHAITARRNGVDVEEFGLGLPPRAKILGKYKGTLITLNWFLPLGGFCNLKGESNDAEGKGTFGAAKYWSKTKILLSGIFVNLITAMVIFSVMSATGLPRITEDQFYIPSDTKILTSPVVINNIGSDSPAQKAGLRKGDILLLVAGLKLDETNKLPDITRENKGKEIEVVFERDGAEQTVKVQLRDSGTSGFLGASASQSEYMQSTWSAPIVGIINTFQFAWMTLQGLGDLVVNFVGGVIGSMSFDDATREAAHNSLGSVSDSVSGPVGILGVLFPSVAAAGIGQVFFLMGIISLTLAIMNFLPIPGLDGGRWLLMTIFKIFRKPLPIELEGKINGIGMMCLIGLIILITIADVMKFW